MTKIKIIKEATIIPTKLKDLKIGDYIIYSNLKCKIVAKNSYSNRDDEKVVAIEQFEDEVESLIWLPYWIFYYKIIKCKDEEIDLN